MIHWNGIFYIKKKKGKKKNHTKLCHVMIDSML